MSSTIFFSKTGGVNTYGTIATTVDEPQIQCKEEDSPVLSWSQKAKQFFFGKQKLKEGADSPFPLHAHAHAHAHAREE